MSNLPAKNKFDPAFPLIDSTGRPTAVFRDYMTKLDTLVSALSGGLNNLTNAANDGAAAAAGVPVGGLYRTGSLIAVRVA